MTHFLDVEEGDNSNNEEFTDLNGHNDNGAIGTDTQAVNCGNDTGANG